MPTWHLYLIRTRGGSLYTGIATNVARRIEEHRSNSGKCARYLRGRAPLRLVYTCPIGDRSLALQVENRIKKLPKHQKEQIVRSKPGCDELIMVTRIR
ncbi:MAG: GIY-YIG nuclease family protein [Candidatus Latescibacterota bacterium]